MVESRIVIPVVVGSNPISHPTSLCGTRPQPKRWFHGFSITRKELSQRQGSDIHAGYLIASATQQASHEGEHGVTAA